MKIGIIADDLTGAADSVAPFAKRGYRAEVRFFQRGMKSPGAMDALALDTGSRDSPMKDTLRDLTFRRAARVLAACGPDIIFKKVDSTLRGHLRVELDAMRHVLPERLPVVCSAFPANGRVIRDGELRVHGELHNRSICAAFGYADGDGIRKVSLAELRQGADALSARLNEARNGGASCLFCDAETEADLDILAQALLEKPGDYLPVGSAGLSSAFARQLPVIRDNAGEIETLLNVFQTGRVLVVIGSLHEVSRNQMRHFSERAGVLPIVPESGVNWDALCQGVYEPLDDGQRFLIVTTPETFVEGAKHANFGYRSFLLSSHKSRARNKNMPFDALLVTGGESAKNVLYNFNGNGLQCVGEIQPGVVLGRMTANEAGSQIFRDFPVLLKSGGFGTLNLIATILGLE